MTAAIKENERQDKQQHQKTVKITCEQNSKSTQLFWKKNEKVLKASD